MYECKIYIIHIRNKLQVIFEENLRVQYTRTEIKSKRIFRNKLYIIQVAEIMYEYSIQVQKRKRVARSYKL